MNQVALGAVLSVLFACGLAAYDRLVVRPAQVVGVVDLAEVYRAKEAELVSLLTTSRSEEDRQRAMEAAGAFARRLPVALDELPADCRCLVILRSAVAGRTPNTRDLTALLKSKLEQP